MRIVHKCHTCGHLDTAGWEGDSSARTNSWPRKGCGQKCHSGPCKWDESHVSITYTITGAVEDHIYPPGSGWNGVDLCNCGRCRQLYEEVAQ